MILDRSLRVGMPRSGLSLKKLFWGENCGRGLKEPRSMVPQKHTESGVHPDTLTIPELEQSKAAVLNTLASVHSRRSYAFAIDRFIAWYCSEPRLTFNLSIAP